MWTHFQCMKMIRRKPMFYYILWTIAIIQVNGLLFCSLASLRNIQQDQSCQNIQFKSNLTVQEASDVLKIIDLHMEDLDPFFREFNVLHTEAAESGLNSFPAFLGASFNKTSGDSMVIILWLGGLCIFLFALLVLVLSLVSFNVNCI